MQKEIPFQGMEGKAMCITRRQEVLDECKRLKPPLETKTTNSIPEGNL